MANEAYKAVERDGIYFIDCPECGREIQTRQAEFESMDEAFCEALGRCTCEGAREWRRIKPSNVIEIGAESAQYDTAPCRFCGQMQTVVPDRLGGLTPVEYVTRLCRCASARDYQRRLERERQRAQDLERAQSHVRDLFSDFKAREKVHELLTDCCAMVYDAALLKVSVSLDGEATAVVSRNSKESLKIERKEHTSEGVEI